MNSLDTLAPAPASTPAKASPRRAYATFAVCVLLLLFGLQLAFTVHQESLSWDEGDHIFAGYMAWKTHDHGLNPEHPPLVKMLATVPLLQLDLKRPPLQHRFFKTESYLDGHDLLFGNAPRYSAESLTFRVRMMAAMLALLLALMVFLTAREMFGYGAGLLALGLLTFEPNVLAHGAMIATDTGVCCFFVASIYAFYRYCKSPSMGRLAVAGVAAGLALASKHSAVLLLPMLVLLACCEVAFRFGGEDRRKRALRMVGALAAICVIGVAVLWAFYGFRYNARPGALRLDPTLAEYVLPLRPMEAKGILLVAHFHLLPESYLYGLADVRNMANGMPSYFFGKVYEHGIWYYFPTVLAIKCTLGFLGMLLLALGALAAGRFRRWREILFLGVPAGLYLFVAMTSHLNIGARHILPVIVFLCMFTAGGCWALVERAGSGWHRGWACAVGVLLLMHVASSARTYPNYMAYSNELWGGPSQTYHYLTDSNTDWGQQLLAVKKYTDAHGIKNCWFAYFVDPFLLPKDYGIPCKALPTADTWFTKVERPAPGTIEGPVLISAGVLTGFEYGSNVLNPYRGFQGLKPVASIQDGVLVFDGTFQVPLASALSHVQESNRLRALKDLSGALAEAQQAVAIAPGELFPQLALGDSLAAASRKDEARAAYEHAMDVVQTMEPEARTEWGVRVRKKIAAL